MTLVLGQALDGLMSTMTPFGDVHIAQLGGHLHGVFHAAAGDSHLAAVLGGHRDDLLDAVHVGGEGGDDDALLAAPEQASKEAPTLRSALGVKPGRSTLVESAQKGQHALLAQLTQPGQVDHAAPDGGGVDLKVAGVDARAHRALDGKGHRVGDGVVDMDEFHANFPALTTSPASQVTSLVAPAACAPPISGGPAPGVIRVA